MIRPLVLLSFAAALASHSSLACAPGAAVPPTPPAPGPRLVASAAAKSPAPAADPKAPRAVSQPHRKKPVLPRHLFM